MKLKRISCAILILLLLSAFLLSCGTASPQDPVSSMNGDFATGSLARHYANIDGKSYIDLNLLSADLTLDKLSQTAPYGNPYMAEIFGIAADGEFLYCMAQNLQIKEDDAMHFRYGLYKIDIETGTAQPLCEWEKLGSGGSYSMAFDAEYVYFFKADETTNQLCRVKKNGEGFEQITENKDTILTGVFVYDDSIYYIKDKAIYKSGEESSPIIENIQSAFLYGGGFCYVRLLENGKESLYSADISGENEKLVCESFTSDMYIVKNDTAYFCVFDPVILVENPDGSATANGTQGKIFSLDLNTGKQKLLVQAKELAISAIFNVSDSGALVLAHTEADLIKSAEAGVGLINEYYLIDIKTGEYRKITDKTLDWAGK